MTEEEVAAGETAATAAAARPRLDPVRASRIERELREYPRLTARLEWLVEYLAEPPMPAPRRFGRGGRAGVVMGVQDGGVSDPTAGVAIWRPRMVEESWEIRFRVKPVEYFLLCLTPLQKAFTQFRYFEDRPMDGVAVAMSVSRAGVYRLREEVLLAADAAGVARRGVAQGA